MLGLEEGGLDGARRFRIALGVASQALIILVLVALAIRELAVILQPLAISIFLLYLILPAHSWLVRHRIPSAVSYLLLVVLVLGITGGLSVMVMTSLSTITSKTAVYEHRLDVIYGMLVGAVPFHVPGFEVAHVRDLPFVQEMMDENLLKTVRSTLGTFLGFFTSTLVVIIYTIFLVAEAAGFRRRIVTALGEEQGGRIMEIVGSINVAISRYIAVKTFVSIVVALVATAVLGAFQVDFFILWGCLTFFANFIPYLGAVVLTAIPVMLTFLQYDEPWKGFAVLALLSSAHFLVGYVFEPLLAGRRLDVSPIFILLSLAFGGWLWGITGMLLAVPLMVILKIILGSIDQTKPIARFLGH